MRIAATVAWKICAAVLVKRAHALLPGLLSCQCITSGNHGKHQFCVNHEVRSFKPAVICMSNKNLPLLLTFSQNQLMFIALRLVLPYRVKQSPLVFSWHLTAHTHRTPAHPPQPPFA